MSAPSERVYVAGLPSDIDDAKLRAIFGEYGTLKEVKNLVGKNACILNFSTVNEAQWIVDNLDGNMPEGLATPLICKFAKPQGSGGGGWGGSGGGGWGADNRFSPYGAPGGKGGVGGGVAGKGGELAGDGGPVSIQMLKKGLLMADAFPGQGRGKKTPDELQVFVRGLPADTSDADLYEIFGCFGGIPPRGVKAMLQEDGSCNGKGFVDFTTAEAAQAATSLDGMLLPDGSYLRVSIKNTGRGGKGPWQGGKGAAGKSTAMVLA